MNQTGRSSSSRRPLCWHGTACRNRSDPQHCERYDHQPRPCRFGPSCRRRGRGCRYQHDGVGGGEEVEAGSTNASNVQLGTGSEPERPIPFLLFVFCVSALGLLLLPLVGECDADRHKQMLGVGCVLLLPLILLKLLLLVNRSWIVRKFLEGDYSERATCRKLGCLWYPTPLQQLRFTSGAVEGNNIETYGTWETNDMQQHVEYVTGGNRDGGQVSRVAGSPGSFQCDFPENFGACTVELDRNCDLRGLSPGMEASFDGNNITSEDGAWAKAGYWRLDTVTKVLLLLFLLGVEFVFVAMIMPPGVRGLGGVGGEHERIPLKAIFVVDGSGSIDDKMWKSQRKAGQEFIHAFEHKYGGLPGGLNIGIVQFASEAKVELKVTSNIKEALNTLGAMTQLDGGTQYDKALQACHTNLGSDDDARESFEVCVLITDGEDGSGESPEALQQMAGGDDTAIFGIFVGATQGGEQTLRKTTACGKAQARNKQCDFFASATDFEELATKADGVASEVTKAVDIAMCAMTSALIGLPTMVAMCLPYILWYVFCTGIAMRRRRREANNSYHNLEIDTAVGRE